MSPGEFRDKVRRTFGTDLHRASPATVRDFLDHLQVEIPDAAPTTMEDGSHRFVIDESARSYEEVMRTFFNRVLDLPEDEAVIMLWTVAFDLAYAVIESHDSDRIGQLFRGLEESAP